MATFEKIILARFSRKLGNGISTRWGGKNAMRSLEQAGK